MNEDRIREIKTNEERLRAVMNLSDTEIKKYAAGEIKIIQPQSYLTVWDYFSQPIEVSPETVADYENRRKITKLVTPILRLFKDKGLLEEVIISIEERWSDETVSMTIIDILNEVIDEHTKKWKRCTRYHFGGWQPNNEAERTNDETCWQCGGKLIPLTEEEIKKLDARNEDE